MQQCVYSRYIIFIYFGCMFFLTACSPKPKLVVVSDIANKNSALLKVLNCDEFLGSQDGWNWVTKSLTQKDKGDYVWAQCILGGQYQQHGLLVTYDLKKSKIKVTINASDVKSASAGLSGVETAPPDFVKTGQAMFSYCIEDTKLSHCFLEVQYDSYTTLFVGMTIDSKIPFSTLPKLINANLLQQEAMIKGELVP
ncbi:MAG: hypothetical protein WA821_13420 [Anaerolineales bacterium]